MPPIIELDESEMFYDNNGNEVDILVVGERTCNGCFFYLKDISKKFQLNSAHDLITKSDSNFTKNTDYSIFITRNSGYPRVTGNKKKSQLFLTYTGLLKLLFTSRKGNHVAFLMWITETVFTAHLGTKEDKIKLASDMIGASPLAIKEVFNTFANTLPCIYLFQLGTVKSLRKTMKIDEEKADTDLVVKWGYTIDLARRTKEHNRKKSYGGIKGCSLQLLCNSFIDLQYASKAENEIKDYFIDSDYHFNFDNFAELAIIPIKHLKTIKGQYTNLGIIYAGRITELTNKIEMLKIQHEIELAQKETILTQKESEVLRESNRADIAQKEIEILQLKLQIASNHRRNK